MHDTDLYGQMPGLQSPWSMKHVDSDVAKRRIDLWFEHAAGCAGRACNAILSTITLLNSAVLSGAAPLHLQAVATYRANSVSCATRDPGA